MESTILIHPVSLLLPPPRPAFLLLSWTPTRMTATLAGLISRLYSPPAVIELLITVSVEFAIHRWTSVYVPRK